MLTYLILWSIVFAICTARFNIKSFYILPTEFIYGICMILRKKTAIITLYSIKQ
jgi:tRNA A37 threonylcarbamoyladenosine synthetase subunit TsaC/SUA5/YrdC